MSTATKIRVSEETLARLSRYASAMKRLGRGVTFDRAIRELLEEAGRRGDMIA